MTAPVTSLDIATARILVPAGIDHADLSRVLGALATSGADLADLYFETTKTRRWRL